jgi:hypothetical protein
MKSRRLGMERSTLDMSAPFLPRWRNPDAARPVCYKAAQESAVLDQLTFEKAKGLEGTSFWVYPEHDHKVELRVVEVARVMESEAAKLKRTAFSIYLLGPDSYRLKQGSFPMTHDAFPEPFYMFLTAIGQDGRGFLYEAVFT